MLELVRLIFVLVETCPQQQQQQKTYASDIVQVLKYAEGNSFVMRKNKRITWLKTK